MLQPPVEFFAYATIVRLSIAFGAVLAIYLGYKLFVAGYTKPQEVRTDMHAQAGDVSLRLRNAAPGTMFALFGAGMLIATFVVGVPEYKVKFPYGGEFHTRGQKPNLEQIARKLRELSIERAAPLFASLGSYYEDQNRHGEALAYFMLTEVITPEEHSAAAGVARMLALQGRCEDARLYLQQIEGLESTTVLQTTSEVVDDKCH